MRPFRSLFIDSQTYVYMCPEPHMHTGFTHSLYDPGQNCESTICKLSTPILVDTNLMSKVIKNNNQMCKSTITVVAN